jgi:hypothetical protein
VKQRLVLLACLALGFSASPALAFKNVAGCDIVAFAAKDSPVVLAPERWQAYRAAAETILGAAPQAQASMQEWRPVAAELIGAQRSLLAPEHASKAYQDYLAGDSCRVLARLDSGAVETLLGEVAQSTSEQAASAALRGVTQAARTQIDRIERSARFRSGQDKTLFAAHYYCFVAGAIVALLPPERQQKITLDDFGNTVGCKEAGRTE